MVQETQVVATGSETRDPLFSAGRREKKKVVIDAFKTMAGIDFQQVTEKARARWSNRAKESVNGCECHRGDLRSRLFYPH